LTQGYGAEQTGETSGDDLTFTISTSDELTGQALEEGGYTKVAELGDQSVYIASDVVSAWMNQSQPGTEGSVAGTAGSEGYTGGGTPVFSGGALVFAQEAITAAPPAQSTGAPSGTVPAAPSSPSYYSSGSGTPVFSGGTIVFAQETITAATPAQSTGAPGGTVAAPSSPSYYAGGGGTPVVSGGTIVFPQETITATPTAPPSGTGVVMPVKDVVFVQYTANYSSQLGKSAAPEPKAPPTYMGALPQGASAVPEPGTKFTPKQIANIIQYLQIARQELGRRKLPVENALVLVAHTFETGYGTSGPNAPQNNIFSVQPPADVQRKIEAKTGLPFPRPAPRQGSGVAPTPVFKSPQQAIDIQIGLIYGLDLPNGAGAEFPRMGAIMRTNNLTPQQYAKALSQQGYRGPNTPAKEAEYVSVMTNAYADVSRLLRAVSVRRYTPLKIARKLTEASSDQAATRQFDGPDGC
jgi:hypothetical protein